MSSHYERIIDFMNRYLEAYSNIAQNPETQDGILEYYTSDLNVIAYFPEKNNQNLDQFLEMSRSHPQFHGRLTAEYYIVDEIRNQVAALLKGVYTIAATGEKLEQFLYCDYKLVVDENDSMKIAEFICFTEYVSPDRKNVVDLYTEVLKLNGIV